MKANRKFLFCLFTTLTLITLGVLTSPDNAYHWAFYVIGILLLVMSYSQLPERRLPLLLSGNKVSSEQRRIQNSIRG